MKAKQRKLQKEKEKEKERQEKLSKRTESNQNSSSRLLVGAPQILESPAKLPSVRKLKNESHAPSPMKHSPKHSNSNQVKPPDSPPHLPTETEKTLQLQKMMKLFNIQNISLDSIHPEPNAQYIKWKEEVRQLEEEIQIQEDKLQLQILGIAEETKTQREEIDALETELFNSGKGEVIALKDSNKYYDSQIRLLTNKLEAMNSKDIKEKKVDNKIKDEIQLTKMRLEREIIEVRKIKDELVKIKKGTIPFDIQKRIEVMMKYYTSV